MAHEPKEASVFKHRKMMLKAIVIAGDAWPTVYAFKQKTTACSPFGYIIYIKVKV